MKKTGRRRRMTVKNKHTEVTDLIRHDGISDRTNPEENNQNAQDNSEQSSIHKEDQTPLPLPKDGDLTNEISNVNLLPDEEYPNVIS